ncbi:MAG: amidohydrolase, partial [Sphingomicrobium sp.]
MRTIARTPLIGAAVLAALLLTGCATAEKKPAARIRINENPYASTYARYPGVPTLIKGATILDGEGGRIDNGSVLFADGKVVAVGDASLVAP